MLFVFIYWFVSDGYSIALAFTYADHLFKNDGLLFKKPEIFLKALQFANIDNEAK